MSTTDEAPHPDVTDLARFGYRQELKRTLSIYSSFAVAFSYISPSTGIFTLYALGLGFGGPFFIWSWPIVVVGQAIVGLNFAEVSSHFPVAGSVYQWTKYLSNRTYAWFTGWIYLFAGVITITAVDATMPIALIPFLNGLGLHLNNDSPTQITIAVIILASTTLLNIFGVRLVAIINNTGVVFEILGMVVFAIILLIFFRHQSPSVVFDTSALGSGFSNQAGTFAIAMFMSLFVIFGFDTAATLAEETKNPRREAPRAILLAIGGAAVIGAIFLFATLLAIPGDIHKYVADLGAVPPKAAPPVDIITGNLPGWAANLYLLVVAAAIYVCCLAIQTATIRLAFGMARDGKLPFGRFYNNVSPSLHTPVGTSIVIAVLAAIPLLYYSGVATIAIAATGMIYIAYLLGNFAVLRARLQGWPKEDTPFKLGSWGMLVNVLAIAWGATMLVNFLWPRGATNPPLSSLPGWGLGDALGSIPIFEATLGVIVIVGAIYYFIALRNSPETPQVRPASVDAASA